MNAKVTNIDWITNDEAIIEVEYDGFHLRGLVTDQSHRDKEKP